jgi:2-alkyl-3-oxoalkanoate reductase
MALAGKTVLVTGATGFLGGALVEQLSQEGVRVRALARNPQKTKRIEKLSGVEIVLGDMTDADAMHEAMRGCEIVFHSAAALGGPIATQRHMNVTGTHNVVHAAAAAGILRIVHVSTIAVYGYKQSGDVSEETPLNPGYDPYNITKAEAEFELQRVAQEKRLPYSILRPGMIYGPRSGMWTRTLFRLARVRPTPWLGSGDGSAFPIYVDDVVDLMMVLAKHPKAVSQTFNCTPDPSPTWREFLGAYARLAGHNGWLAFPPMLVSPFAAVIGALARPNTQLKELPNLLRLTQTKVTFKMAKARDLLGWQPKVDLQTGVERCAPWLREKGLLK